MPSIRLHFLILVRIGAYRLASAYEFHPSQLFRFVSDVCYSEEFQMKKDFKYARRYLRCFSQVKIKGAYLGMLNKIGIPCTHFSSMFRNSTTRLENIKSIYLTQYIFQTNRIAILFVKSQKKAGKNQT